MRDVSYEYALGWFVIGFMALVCAVTVGLGELRDRMERGPRDGD